MLESIINLVSSGAVDSHTPQTAVAAVLCAAMIGPYPAYKSNIFNRFCRPDKRSASGNLVLSTLMALSFSTL